MNEIAIKERPSGVDFFSERGFDLIQRMAKALSSSDIVPAAYRSRTLKGKPPNQTVVENPNALANCMVAIDVAGRLGVSPIVIMQNLDIIEGKPRWSSKWTIAALNRSGKFSPLRFEITDLGPKEVKYTERQWVNGRSEATVKSVNIHDVSCVAWALERGTGERLESSPVTLELAVMEGWYTKSGSKWQTMADQMLRYRAATFFGAVYAPELTMGFPAEDEVIDITPEWRASEDAPAQPTPPRPSAARNIIPEFEPVEAAQEPEADQVEATEEPPAITEDEVSTLALHITEKLNSAASKDDLRSIAASRGWAEMKGYAEAFPKMWEGVTDCLIAAKERLGVA